MNSCPPNDGEPKLPSTTDERIRALFDEYRISSSETFLSTLINRVEAMREQSARDAEIKLVRKAANEGITTDQGTSYHLVPDWLIGSKLVDAFAETRPATPMGDPAADVTIETQLEAEVEVAEDWSTVTISGTPELVKRMLHIEDPE